MSAAKRASISRSTTTKKSAKKTTKTVAKKTITTKKTRKKTTKKTTKQVRKRVAKKTVKKVVKRVVKRPKNAAPQSVREARYGGHENTMPTNPSAPGRLLGKTVTLSMAGVTAWQLNADTIAIAVARFSGVGIMVVGLALSWNLFNQLNLPTAQQVATTAVATELVTPAITIAEVPPLEGESTAVVTVAGAERVTVVLKNLAGETTVLGAATQRTSTTWELLFDSAAVADGVYQLLAVAEVAHEYTLISAETSISVSNGVESLLEEVLATTTESAIAASSSASVSTTAPLLAPTTTMATVVVPEVHATALLSPSELLVLGWATPEQPLELLMLRNNIEVAITTQADGWWSIVLPAPKAAERYEVYARATDAQLSAPLDFTQIAGRIYKPQSLAEADTQQNTAAAGTVADSTIWYLLAAVTTMVIGLVLILLGHHLHHTRRRDEEPSLADQESI